MEDFSTRLRRIMNERGISQSELSRLSGIPKSALSQYMSGLFRPKQDRTLALAKALAVDPAWLLGYDVPSDAAKKSGSGTKKSEEDFHILDAYKSLSPEERKLVSDYIDTLTSAHRGREKLSRDDSLHSGEVFRAAKSSGGNASPGREQLSEEDLGRISSAPETDEDL